LLQFKTGKPSLIYIATVTLAIYDIIRWAAGIQWIM